MMGSDVFAKIYQTVLKSEIEERYRRLAIDNEKVWQVNI